MKFYPIETEAEYDNAVVALNALLDAGASDENHPLVFLAVAIGNLVDDYDNKHYKKC